jgi:hypothetical protein
MTLDFVSQEKLHLIGDLTLQNNLSVGNKTQTLIVVGIQGEDGTFRPNVLLQVKKDEKSQWETLSSSLDRLASATLTVYPGLAVYGLRVELDSMRRYLGKYAYGKVSLKGGPEAVFALDDLKPPPAPTATP